jgi:6-phosphogluconolactonase
VIDLRYRLFPWEQTHVWLVDERCVPFDDERSNGRMIHEALMAHVPTPEEQVHFVPTEADDPAAAYETQLREVFGAAGIPRMDFVLLGMGSDGHTASLFPNSPALDEASRWITNNEGPNVTPPPRVTMTYPLLNAAREIVVLVAGASKAEMLARIDEQLRDEGLNIQKYPITGVVPDDGELVWLLDRAAAVGT